MNAIDVLNKVIDEQKMAIGRKIIERAKANKNLVADEFIGEVKMLADKAKFYEDVKDLLIEKEEQKAKEEVKEEPQAEVVEVVAEPKKTTTRRTKTQM